MFVDSPIPYIQAPDLDESVFLGLLQDAFCERARAELRKERQDVKTDHILRLLDSCFGAQRLNAPISELSIWPVTGKPCFAWKDRIAARVSGPITPSIRPL